MDFSNKTPIYLQIVEVFYHQILEKRWAIGERIPSVREAATNMEVNPNTMMRVYAHLQTTNIIYNKRGIGYFVAEDAQNIILSLRRAEFLDNELPVFLKNLKMLGLGWEDLRQWIEVHEAEDANPKL